MISRRKLNIRTGTGVYAIILQKWEGDMGYVVRVPAFPEIVTQGESVKESKEMAKDAIALCVESITKEKQSHGDHSNIKSQRRTPSALAARV